VRPQVAVSTSSSRGEAWSWGIRKSYGIRLSRWRSAKPA